MTFIKLQCANNKQKSEEGNQFYCVHFLKLQEKIMIITKVRVFANFKDPSMARE